MKNISSFLDATLLKPDTPYSGYREFLEKNSGRGFNSLCIPSSFVKEAKKYATTDKISTVIGFPVGYSTTESKVYEIKQAIDNGADYIDTVINLIYAKDINKIIDFKNELMQIRKASDSKELRIIIEYCYLTNDEIERIVPIISETGCDFVKTSTGFGSAGANEEIIKKLAKLCGNSLKIKASGGIKTYEQSVLLINSGASVIGTSNALEISGFK